MAIRSSTRGCLHRAATARDPHRAHRCAPTLDTRLPARSSGPSRALVPPLSLLSTADDDGPAPPASPSARDRHRDTRLEFPALRSARHRTWLPTAPARGAPVLLR